MINILIRLILVSVFPLFLHAGTYDDNYKIVKKNQALGIANDNTLMQGSFLNIIRFKAIHFNSDNSIDKDSKEELKRIISTIKKYSQTDDVVVSIIGYTSDVTDHENELSVRSKTYMNYIEDRFKYSLDSNESNKRSKMYAKNIEDILVDNNISKDILVVEHRGGKDLAFSDATVEGRDLSNRASVALYIKENAEIDTDKDGVFDVSDDCPGTIRGAKVDERGCPVDSDKDGVFDYMDQCPATPKDVKVDRNGCPYDSDKDGIYDYMDKCPDTIAGLEVDVKGCPLKETLELNFEAGSAKILDMSHDKILEFAQFLRDNKGYKVRIIGHTDSVGKAGVNMKLSQDRAEAVKTALISEGIEADRIITLGKGELEPIKSNRTAEGRKANRRIEVELFY